MVGRGEVAYLPHQGDRDLSQQHHRNTTAGHRGVPLCLSLLPESGRARAAMGERARSLNMASSTRLRKSPTATTSNPVDCVTLGEPSRSHGTQGWGSHSPLHREVPWACLRMLRPERGKNHVVIMANVIGTAGWCDYSVPLPKRARAPTRTR